MTTPARTVDIADVFISHAQSTTALTRRIAAALRALDHTVWWDEELPVHRPFSAVIDERLGAAKAIVVLWSNDAIASDWVRAEAEAGRVAGRLVQVSADGTVPPRPFNMIQYADLNGWRGDVDAPNWRKVVASIGELTGETAPTHGSAGPARKIGARRSLRSALALVIAAFRAMASWFAVTHSKPASASAVTVSSAHNETADVNVAPAGVTERPAIAVLPFENHSEDPQHAIFADGLAEDLIMRLSAWRSFRVIAPASSFRYRDNVDVRRIAKDLNVRYVVQGSVRRAGDRIRVTTQLVDAQSSATLWSQTYDRPVAGMFDLQDEISSAIAAPLVGDLSRAEANRARQRGTRNLEAWSLYELGVEHHARGTLPDYGAALALFQQAIAIEPQFASAHAKASRIYAMRWSQQMGRDDGDLALALQFARRAVELDNLDAQAHQALGFGLVLSGDPRSGLVSLNRAVELNPSLPTAWNSLGFARLASGDAEGCIEATTHMLDLDPHGPDVHLGLENLSEAHWMLGQFDTGLDYARTVVAHKPDYIWGHFDVILNAVELARIDEARSAIVAAHRIEPRFSQAVVVQASGFAANPAMKARVIESLRKAGLE